MVIKCKMCGGDILFHPGETSGQCEYCGSTSTIPKVDDEQRLNRYNRANHFRRQGEFDKAITAYERILEEDDTDAEAHWGAALSRYGIEYVEDPVSRRRIPTCHRVQLESILADPDYQAAVKYAPDTLSRNLYEEQAKEIAEIQKGILAISANEKPYDVFICYKESDESGQRTRDSALAQEVYYGLTEQGYKVFFSRIILEDKLGQEYEPYIFAALNSARVMVVIGTKPEYFNAVWVKNEWSRYLHLMKNDRKRLLIPCYRDMDPYDLPEELGNLQSQDMSRIGFIQDLLRGIRKVLEENRSGAASQAQSDNKAQASAGAVSPLLRRAMMFLEDEDWTSADEYAEKVLDLEPENGQAYLVKLMVNRKVTKPDMLAWQATPFLDDPPCRKLLRYGESQLVEQVKGWNQSILDRIEKEKQEEAARLEREAVEKTARKKLIEETEQQVKTIELAFANARRDSLEIRRKINEIQTAKHELENAKKQIAEKEAAVRQVQTELSNLRGFFVGTKRKQLESELLYKQREIDNIKTKLPAMEERAGQPMSEEPQEPDVRAMHYQIGQLYLKSNMNFQAYTRFVSIRGYSDVDQLLKNDSQLLAVAQYEVGKTVSFGTYPQTRNKDDRTAIEWIVLAREGPKALLLSKYGLDAKPYNNELVDITWEKSSLRTWLNSSFFNTAFNEKEQAAMLNISVDNSIGQGYSFYITNGGNNTQDRIFLLSYHEVFDLYFSSDESRKCVPTDYAIAQGAWISNEQKVDGRATGWWWLRSPGRYQGYAMRVIGGGSSHNVNGDDVCVRPAFWLNLESDIF